MGGVLPPARRILKGEPEEGGKAHLMRDQEQQHRAVNSQGNLKVLDFSADNDQEGDSNGEQTGASLNAGALPFTICSSLTAEAWQTKSARGCSHCLMTAANGDIFTCLPS